MVPPDLLDPVECFDSIVRIHKTPVERHHWVTLSGVSDDLKNR
jgi:hypothetical protein